MFGAVERTAWQAATAEAFTWRVFGEVLDALHRPVNMPPLRVVSGSWQMSGVGGMVTSGSLTVPMLDESNPAGPVDWRPTKWGSPLSPWGNRIRVHIEVTPDGGAPVSCPLGIGLIMSVTSNRPDQTLTVELGDLAEEMSQAKTLYDYPQSTNHSHRWMCDRLLEWAEIPRRPRLFDPYRLVSDDPGKPLPADLSYNAGSDSFDLLLDAARLSSPSNTVRVDRLGRFAVYVDHPFTDADRTPAVATIRSGRGGHLIGVEAKLSRRGAVNAVAVTVEDTNVKDAAATTSPSPVSGVTPSIATPAPDGAGLTWQQKFAQVAIQNAMRMISHAKAQVGNSEANGGAYQYMDFFGYDHGVEWCGIFVAWLMETQGIPSPIPGRSWIEITAYVPNAWALLGPWAGPARNGSIVMFTWQHIGLCVDASTAAQGFVTTVEGNASEEVMLLQEPLENCRYFFNPDYSLLSGARAAVAVSDDPADTGSFATAQIHDGSPLDFKRGTLGRATLVETVRLRDPDRGQAQRHADQLLGQRRGLTRQVRVEAVPMPWLDPGDVVEVVYGDLSERVRVEGWRLSFGDRLSFTVDGVSSAVTAPSAAPLLVGVR